MSREPAIAERVIAAQGDPLAADALIRDYLPFIKTETAKTTGRIPLEGQDDELSIAMIAFHEAVEGYDRLKGPFLKFAAVAIRRRLIDHHRRESRHAGAFSLDTPLSQEEDGPLLADTVEDKADAYGEMELRDATRQEIQELIRQLTEYGLSLTDISENCPQQGRTLTACRRALTYARENPELIQETKKTGRLPMAALTEGSGAERKTLERHRKYLMALLLIYSNGYEIIRGHLKQVLVLPKGGESA